MAHPNEPYEGRPDNDFARGLRAREARDQLAPGPRSSFWDRVDGSQPTPDSRLFPVYGPSKGEHGRGMKDPR